MCGASSQQDQMFAAQSAFYTQMTQQYNTIFGKNQAILDSLTSTFEPILKAGPNQRGFSQDEHDTLDTQANESVSNNFAAAKRSLGENLAARGGSDFLPSGVDEQLEGGIDATAATEKSNLDNQIEMADFETGREEFHNAANVLGGVAAQDSPVAFANATTGAGSAAANTADQIAAEDNSIWSTVIGGVSGIAGAAVGGWAKGHFGGGSN